MECGFVAGVVWLERTTCMFASTWLLMIQNLKNHKSPLMSTCMPMSKSLIISITHVNYWIYTGSIWWISQQNHHDQHSNTHVLPSLLAFSTVGFQDTFKLTTEDWLKLCSDLWHWMRIRERHIIPGTQLEMDFFLLWYWYECASDDDLCI